MGDAHDRHDRHDMHDMQLKYDPNDAVEILSRTPSVLTALLRGLPAAWTDAREGPQGWSPREIIGHLIHGERTDWIPRAELILGDQPDKRFEPFDMKAHLSQVKDRSVEDLLAEFTRLRAANVMRLASYRLTDEDLGRKGIHPELEEVTLRQHLSTWVVHDCSHIAQIVRVMAKQYRQEVGPWVKFHPILDYPGKR
jgi:hypothetical protein